MKRITLSKLELELVRLALESLEDSLETTDVLPRIAIEDLKVKIKGE